MTVGTKTYGPKSLESKIRTTHHNSKSDYDNDDNNNNNIYILAEMQILFSLEHAGHLPLCLSATWYEEAE
jgi:hypothetical protein